MDWKHRSSAGAGLITSMARWGEQTPRIAPAPEAQGTAQAAKQSALHFVFSSFCIRRFNKHICITMRFLS